MPGEKEGGVWISWSDLIKLNNDIAAVRMEQKVQSEKMDIMKEDIGILKDNQQEVKMILDRSRGAVYVLMILGVVVGALFGFSKDIFLKLWRP